MSYSLRTKLKHLAHKCELTEKECERLIKALDTVDAVEEIKAEIKEVGYIKDEYGDVRSDVIKVHQVLNIIDKHISRKEQE